MDTIELRSNLTAVLAECDESISSSAVIAEAARSAAVEAADIVSASTKTRDGIAAVLAALPADPQPEPSPIPQPQPDPGPVTPPPPPATPKPPASAYDRVMALKSKVTEVRHSSGHMVTETLIDIDALPAIDRGDAIPGNVTYTASEAVLTGKFVGDFRMNIGNRQLTILPGADVGLVDVYGRAPKGKVAGAAIKTGARVRHLTGVLDGGLGVSKALHQEHTGTGPGTRIASIDEIVGLQVINQQGDGLKVAGSEYGGTLVQDVIFGQQELGYKGAHYDQVTIMAAIGGIRFKGCLFDNQIDSDTVGVNNWMQFAPYWPGAVYDGVDTEECVLVHENSNSFALMKGSQYISSAIWNGPISFRTCWMTKAGGAKTIFYRSNNFADVWTNIIDPATGQAI